MLYALVFAAGIAAGWFGKDPITKWYKGAEDYALDLKAKAEALLKK